MFKFGLLSLLAVSPLIGDECAPCISSCSCMEEGPCKGTASLRHREANGIGYSTGYTSLDLFYTPSANGNYYPFLDLRAHVFNDGRPAFNTGLGLRYLPDCTDIVYGINAYWDYRQAKHSAIHQASLGLEFLWPRFDIRLNSYVPFNRHKKGFRNGFSGFQGNNAFFFRKYELAMWGGDLALGYWLYKGCNVGLYTALDGYYFHGDYGKQAGGGLLRAKVNWSDYFTVEGQVSYDSLFKWIGQGEVALHFPFGGSVKRTERRVRNCCDLIDIEQRLTQRPDRFEIIVTSTHKKHARALDPVTGKPLKFIFVSNTSSSNGTFESPFPTLAQAVAAAAIGDAIYIFPGDGTNKGLDTSTILKDRQFLIGSGAAIEMETRFGYIRLPKQTDLLPLIDVSSTDAVILANQNTISGLQIMSRAAGGSAIKSTHPVVDLSVLNCKLAGLGTAGKGISASLDGKLTIQDNEIFGNDTAIDLTFEGDAEAQGTINRNQLNGKTAGLLGTKGNGIGILAKDAACVNLFIESNVVEFEPIIDGNFGIGLIDSSTSIIQASLLFNQITSVPNSFRAMGIITSSSDSAQIISPSIANNQIFVSGPSLGIGALSNDSSLQSLTIIKNQASAPGADGGIISIAFPIGTSDISLSKLGTSSLKIYSPNGKQSGFGVLNKGTGGGGAVPAQEGAVDFTPQ